MLIVFAALHCFATMVHFAHNAIFLSEYPNLPPALTSFDVVVSWVAITCIGAAGLLIYRNGKTLGLWLLAGYAVLGFGGLDHYALASPAAHNRSMNASILFEVITAAILLAQVAEVLILQKREVKKLRSKDSF